MLPFSLSADCIERLLHYTSEHMLSVLNSSKCLFPWVKLKEEYMYYT